MQGSRRNRSIASGSRIGMPRTPAPDSPASDSDFGRSPASSSVVTAVNNGATVRMNRSVSPAATTISSPRSVPHSTSMACRARMNACEQRWIRTSSPPDAASEDLRAA